MSSPQSPLRVAPSSWRCSSWPQPPEEGSASPSESPGRRRVAPGSRHASLLPGDRPRGTRSRRPTRCRGHDRDHLVADRANRRLRPLARVGRRRRRPRDRPHERRPFGSDCDSRNADLDDRDECRPFGAAKAAPLPRSRCPALLARSGLLATRGIVQANDRKGGRE